MLLIPASLLGVVFFSVFLRMRSKLKRLSSLVLVEPNLLEASLVAGETHHSIVRVDSSIGLPLRFSIPLDGVIVEPSELARGDSTLIIDFNPLLSGNYNSEVLVCRFDDVLRFFEGEGFLPFRISFRVYPRVVAVAVEAARFLLGAGGVGFGDQPTQLRGSGLEYAESRLYEPGDYFRYVDWKATARLGRLVVKDHYVEGGVGSHTVFESFAPDPVSLDELSASFLRIVLAYAEMDLSQGFTVHDGGRVLYHGVRLPPFFAVARAMRCVLEGVESGPQLLYEVLEPGRALELRELLEKLNDKSGLGRWFEMAETVNDNEREPYRFMRDFIIEEEEMTQMLFISGLGESSKLIDLSRYAVERGKMIRLITPTRPWLWSQGLEDSYRVWRSQSRLGELFSRSGIYSARELETVL